MPRFRNPIISTANIPDGAITTAKLANLAVTTPKIALLAVGSAQIDNLAVTTAKIGLLAVGAAQIANLAVTDAKIANATITAAKIASLNADAITAGIITGLRYRTAVSGSRLEIRGDTAEAFLRLFDSGGTERATMGLINNAPPEVGILASNASLVLTASGAGSQVFIGATSSISVTGPTTFFNIVSIPAGSAAGPSLRFSSDFDTGIFNPAADTLSFATGGADRGGINATGSWTISPTHANGRIALRLNIERAWDFRQRDTADTTKLELWSTSNKDFVIGGESSGRSFQLRTGSGAASYLSLRDGLTDVGNVETLRLDRGSGTLMREVGYFSSRRGHKREIVELARSTLWRRAWFDDLRPVKFRRRSTGGRELGFVIEDLIAIGPAGEGRFLTTKGDRVGDSPDEFALLAVTVDAVQDLRRRVATLEGV